MPRIANRRYASMAEVMRAGACGGRCGVTCTRAFFLGDLEKDHRPDQPGRDGLAPAPPAVRGGGRRRLRWLGFKRPCLPLSGKQLRGQPVSLTAPLETIEELLTEPGADVLTVSTARASDLSEPRETADDVMAAWP